MKKSKVIYRTMAAIINAARPFDVPASALALVFFPKEAKESMKDALRLLNDHGSDWSGAREGYEKLWGRFKEDKEWFYHANP
jgi:hypothetical protein